MRIDFKNKDYAVYRKNQGHIFDGGSGGEIDIAEEIAHLATGYMYKTKNRLGEFVFKYILGEGE